MEPRRWIVAIGIAIGLGATAAAQQPASIWTQLANTGEVDEADASIYQFHDTGAVAIKSGVTNATLDIRYSISANGNYGFQGDPPEEGPTPCVQLKASLRDTGPGARVVVRLKQMDIGSGTITTLAEIDSNRENLPSTNYILYQQCANVPVDFPFDFRFFTYFVEAQLTKTSASGNPGLKVVQVCGALACEEF
jgi:hypothetical protein